MASKSFHLRPRKSLGQNYLKDKNIITKIVEALHLKEGETVLEIGPGQGALTHELMKHKIDLIAVEKDIKLVEFLLKEFEPFKTRFNLYCQDILKFKFSELALKKKIKVVGNLPYYLTTPILFHLAEERDCVESALLMVQQEVADRILASPGSKSYGRLSVTLRYFADVERVMNVSSSCFFPVPKVNSTVIYVKFKDSAELDADPVNLELFQSIVRAFFSQRRKNILNCLHRSKVADWSKEDWQLLLETLHLATNLRPGDLFLKDFIRLSQAIEKRLKSSDMKA